MQGSADGALFAGKRKQEVLLWMELYIPESQSGT